MDVPEHVLDRSSRIRLRLPRRCGEGHIRLFRPGNIDSQLYPDINGGMIETFTAFEGPRRLASGPLTEIAPAIKRAEAHASQPIAVFSDATGRAVDLDLRGTVDDMLKWLARTNEQPAISSEPRGRGRPKLGVVAREVTLLPRHWEWLNAQPGGASVALRKLVEAARRNNGDADRRRAARDAAYHFMSAMAGNLAHFEEASRALFADDRRRFTSLIAAWPGDIRDHVVKLAYSSDAA
jgi:uncharacterized protein